MGPGTPDVLLQNCPNCCVQSRLGVCEKGGLNECILDVGEGCSGTVTPWNALGAVLVVAEQVVERPNDFLTLRNKPVVKVNKAKKPLSVG